MVVSYRVAERRYNQAGLSRMVALADAVVVLIRPFEAIRKLSPAETFIIAAARTIHSYVRADAAGELHLRQSRQMVFEEVANGHH